MAGKPGYYAESRRLCEGARGGSGGTREGGKRGGRGEWRNGCIDAEGEGDVDVLTIRFYHRGVVLKEDEGKGRDLGGGSILYVNSASLC